MEDLYNNIHLHPMPDTHNLTDKTDKELNALLNPKYNFNILLASLIENHELTDDYLCHLIDNDYYTVRELERTVGAKKNVLRNRYNKTKKLQRLQKEREQSWK